MDHPIIDLYTLLVIIPAILVTPAVIGAVITAISIRLVSDHGGTETIYRAGVTAIVADYAAAVAGIVAIHNTDFITGYKADDYSFDWVIFCSLVAYAAIVGTAVWCWKHPWRYP